MSLYVSVLEGCPQFRGLDHRGPTVLNMRMYAVHYRPDLLLCRLPIQGDSNAEVFGSGSV